MDFSRIAPLLDVPRVQRSILTLVGTGGGAGVARNAVRSGVGRVNLVDFDFVEPANICRQEHMADQVGMLKVEALAAELTRINPEVTVRSFPRDFCAFRDDEIEEHFGDTSVFVFCVDTLAANARGNEVALRLRTPAVWSAVYPRGAAGEIVFWQPGLLSCYRCLCAARYRAAERGVIAPAHDASPDLLSVQFIDAITGMIVLGLLTQGADNFYGRLIAQLRERNFLQVKVDPAYTWHGRDVFAEQLGIEPSADAYCSFVTIARRDPDCGQPPCPDCVKYLGRLPATA